MLPWLIHYLLKKKKVHELSESNLIIFEENKDQKEKINQLNQKLNGLYISIGKKQSEIDKQNSTNKCLNDKNKDLNEELDQLKAK